MSTTHAPDAHGHHDKGADHHPHVLPLAAYFGVWLALVIFTVLTVGASYLDLGRSADFEAAGVTDVASFTSFYWSQQASAAFLIVLLTTVGGLGGAAIYGATNRRSTASGDEVPRPA